MQNSSGFRNMFRVAITAVSAFGLLAEERDVERAEVASREVRRGARGAPVPREHCGTFVARPRGDLRLRPAESELHGDEGGSAVVRADRRTHCALLEQLGSGDAGDLQVGPEEVREPRAVERCAQLVYEDARVRLRSAVGVYGARPIACARSTSARPARVSSPLATRIITV